MQCLRRSLQQGQASFWLQAQRSRASRALSSLLQVRGALLTRVAWQPWNAPIPVRRVLPAQLDNFAARCPPARRPGARPAR